jgi:dinuclear metal center YbgI/SA1388 family protein
VELRTIAKEMDLLLRTSEIPDYPPAFNGVQVEHRGPVTRIAAAVDCSERTIRGAVDCGANLLIVHHGLFWSGPRPITGPLYARIRLLLDHDIALYSSHLPLDAHESLGNSLLLARELGLTPNGTYGKYENIYCGVCGEAEIGTAVLLARLNQFSLRHGGRAIATAINDGRHTRRWAICSGAGINQAALNEAESLGVDTLITGEGPHWSAVDAVERGLVILYGGHYATETLGVQALASHIAQRFGLPWNFVAAPTGL